MTDPSNNPYIPYEYMEIPAGTERTAFLLDCYESLGWMTEKRLGTVTEGGNLLLRRERKILNKMELTRLQNHLESCFREIDILEASKTTKAMISSLTVGIIGTAFMAGSVFAVTANPPIIWLCVLFGIPAFVLWALAPLLYKKMAAKRTAAVNELIAKKYEEIYEICEKGSKLL